jgi:hypothetical protein
MTTENSELCAAIEIARIHKLPHAPAWYTSVILAWSTLVRDGEADAPTSWRLSHQGATQEQTLRFAQLMIDYAQRHKCGWWVDLSVTDKGPSKMLSTLLQQAGIDLQTHLVAPGTRMAYEFKASTEWSAPMIVLRTPLSRRVLATLTREDLRL